MKTAGRHGLVATAWAILAVGTLAVGCGKAGLARLPVCGTVSGANGEKLSGSISFLPTKGTLGPAATTGLVAGAYRFDREDGPTAGPHNVIVNKHVAKDAVLKSLDHETSPASREAGMAGDGKTVWTLSADVPADPPYECDFQLEP